MQLFVLFWTFVKDSEMLGSAEVDLRAIKENSS
jgi:hypothetical protein